MHSMFYNGGSVEIVRIFWQMTNARDAALQVQKPFFYKRKQKSDNQGRL